MDMLSVKSRDNVTVSIDEAQKCKQSGLRVGNAPPHLLRTDKVSLSDVYPPNLTVGNRNKNNNLFPLIKISLRFAFDHLKLVRLCNQITQTMTKARVMLRSSYNGRRRWKSKN
ncbi:Hypothetical predicted protein [Xyrichtys novacula]|uniref:Uncharacterized protein n=1 Tax=Xyrichtys novacula TaxID=13765 RepID=A0AAV1HB54_XYRNO|nr:Hypothetical predicted protein [Xyrichtys novacula]